MTVWMSAVRCSNCRRLVPPAAPTTALSSDRQSWNARLARAAMTLLGLRADIHWISGIAGGPDASGLPQVSLPAVRSGGACRSGRKEVDRCSGQMRRNRDRRRATSCRLGTCPGLPSLERHCIRHYSRSRMRRSVDCSVELCGSAAGTPIPPCCCPRCIRILARGPHRHGSGVVLNTDGHKHMCV